jgi:hypothetical protein
VTNISDRQICSSRVSKRVSDVSQARVTTSVESLNKVLRFQVFAAVRIMMMFFWVVTPCRLAVRQKNSVFIFRASKSRTTT